MKKNNKKPAGKMKIHSKKILAIIKKPNEEPTIPQRDIPEIDHDKTKEDPIIVPRIPERKQHPEPLTKPDKQKPEIPDSPEKVPEIPDYPDTPDEPDEPDTPNYPDTPGEDRH